MAYLLDSNLLIYSAAKANAFLRPLVLDTANFASAISKVETLGFHKLDPIDEAYFDSLFALLSRLVPKLRKTQKRVMLNAGKHLYRFVERHGRSGRDASLRSA